MYSLHRATGKCKKKKKSATVIEPHRYLHVRDQQRRKRVTLVTRSEKFSEVTQKHPVTYSEFRSWPHPSAVRNQHFQVKDITGILTHLPVG